MNIRQWWNRVWAWIAKPEQSDDPWGYFPGELVSELEQGEAIMSYRGVYLLSRDGTHYMYDSGADTLLAAALRDRGWVTEDEAIEVIDTWKTWGQLSQSSPSTGEASKASA
ncbi:MAG TPA: hypothetical protein VMT96_00165 [Candidatus Bathyarchaeia archaeon]|nr:hypothetical protein [Candidatus Bathyarchaeia archaeon]